MDKLKKPEPKPEPISPQEEDDWKEVVNKPVKARYCKRCGCRLRRANNGTLCSPCGGR